MITPVAQRQIFQTAHVEALRQAQEVSEQIQREAAKQRAADDRLTAGMDEVHEVFRSDRIHPDEHQGRREGGGHAQEQEEERAGAEEAPPAEPHLDLLA